MEEMCSHFGCTYYVRIKRILTLTGYLHFGMLGFLRTANIKPALMKTRTDIVLICPHKTNVEYHSNKLSEIIGISFSHLSSSILS